MKCEICGKKDPKVIGVLPIQMKNGNLCTLACEECMKKSHTYCKEHDRIHIGFIDGTTACGECVNKLRQSFSLNQAQKIASTILGDVSVSDAERLRETAEISMTVTGWSLPIAIIHLVATRAVRSKQSVDEVVDNISNTESADSILR